MLRGCLGCVASLLAWLPVVLSLLARVPWRCGFPLRAVARACLPWRCGFAFAVAMEAWSPCACGRFGSVCSCSRGCLGGVVSLRVRSLWKRLFLLSWLPWRRGHLSRAAALEALSPCSRCCLCSAICSLALLPLVAGLSVSLLGISDPFDCLSVPSLARLLPSACVAGLRHGYVGKFHMFA